MTVFVNGVAVTVRGGETAELAAARELLRQRAIALGFVLPTGGDEDEIDAAIEAMLAREITIPEPTEAECRRYYEQHPREFKSGDLVHARHILFQVTLGVDVAALRAHAEQTLLALLREPERFERMARELSNCPSGRQGGNLGQIRRGDLVPELERVLFDQGPIGIRRELVKTRYGFHIIAIDARIPGRRLPFEMVRERIAKRLHLAVEERALSQYISILAGGAKIEGANLRPASTPLVQ